MGKIDWSNLSCMVSSYFRVRDAIWLPCWSRPAVEADGLDDDAKIGLEKIFILLDLVQDILGADARIKVHCAYRPLIYNKQVSGAVASAHIARKSVGSYIAAVDFDADMGLGTTRKNCDRIREILLPKLQDLGLRMEDLADSPWVHLDTRNPGPTGRRYFIP